VPDCLNLLGAMGTILEAEAAAAATGGDEELRVAANLAAVEKYARLADLDGVRSGYWAGQQRRLELQSPPAK
jgi:hypothetical protein